MNGCKPLTKTQKIRLEALSVLLSAEDKARARAEAAAMLADDQIMNDMEDDGWICNKRGWWHPPSCVAAWPFEEAKVMWQRDRERRHK